MTILLCAGTLPDSPVQQYHSKNTHTATQRAVRLLIDTTQETNIIHLNFKVNGFASQHFAEGNFGASIIGCQIASLTI